MARTGAGMIGEPDGVVLNEVRIKKKKRRFTTGASLSASLRRCAVIVSL